VRRRREQRGRRDETDDLAFEHAHPVPVGFAADETMVAAQFIFGGILDRHPHLHLHIPHAGGNTPWLKGRFEMALSKRPWAKGLLSRPLDDTWKQMTFDCLIKSGANMEMLVKAEGAERILGTPVVAALPQMKALPAE
jgi:aminocarboxymuconate-semialdehyde decarboxylase